MVRCVVIGWVEGQGTSTMHEAWILQEYAGLKRRYSLTMNKKKVQESTLGTADWANLYCSLFVDLQLLSMLSINMLFKMV